MFRKIIRKLKAKDPLDAFSDMETWQIEICQRVQPFSMTSIERILATIHAVEYVVRNDIPGAIVECGVWKGGNMMAAALTMLQLSASRPIYLFDTFEGMTLPEDFDIDFRGTPASDEFDRRKEGHHTADWCRAGLDEVRRNMRTTGYPEDLINFVKGPVEVTLPEFSPADIALLRLDTDWYQSTRCELEILYPRVSRLGIVSIDDYGYWQGARLAVDEYIAENKIRCMLHRIDNTARQFVKI